MLCAITCFIYFINYLAHSNKKIKHVSFLTFLLYKNIKCKSKKLYMYLIK